jgi:hypothetical protein
MNAPEQELVQKVTELIYSGVDRSTILALYQPFHPEQLIAQVIGEVDAGTLVACEPEPQASREQEK